jgi:hypothetical protein
MSDCQTSATVNDNKLYYNVNHRRLIHIQSINSQQKKQFISQTTYLDVICVSQMLQQLLLRHVNHVVSSNFKIL